MKVFFRRIHLYLGLASGLLILVVCFTGGILVFEKELEQAWHPERYFVTPATTPRLSLAQLTDAVKAAKPKGKISGFKVYSDPTRTVEVNLAGNDKGGPQGGPSGKPSQPEQRAENRGAEARGPQRGGPDRAEARGPMGGGAGAGGKKGGPGGPGGKGRNVGPRLFVNPYTGAVIDEINPRETFFHFMEEIHRGLVAGRTGKLIMGINSIVFLFILGTGIVLWWPTARKALTQRLKVKWGSGWKRLNHDFHIVLGFYTSIFLLIMALTGVGMSFDWVGNTINTLTHSPRQRPEPPTSTVPTTGGATFGADAALQAAQRQIPAAESYSVQVPKEPTGSIQVGMLRPDALTERATDDVYFDQYSGQVLRQTTYGQQPVGQRIRGLFKPVHTGAIFGWPTKVLAFVIVVLGFTFPITGTILWWNRTRKAKKKPRKLVAA
ncbi:PepSY domain-containing protein [Hymenobacter sp. BT186]|uniref:PepSY domain-containing protein n=1 Tax=Hymenobacter telluris TaxID=2816474 RepID=A0A939JAG7_9BACT|nr:PepSY-associated TM helix domain-containing protein [Hymenobacter telluris]MBO0358076.1 PepSY domain-containing protein [Hymenobacter telluris]MBW3374103.1 PepSY domain-containing protein [Hymenobacter norwichensis]